MTLQATKCICHLCPVHVEEIRAQRTAKRRENAQKPQFDFEAAYQAYPRRLGRKIALARFTAQITTQEQYDNLMKAINNYAIYAENQDPKFIKYFSTFMNGWEDWIMSAEEVSTNSLEKLRKELGE